jgi:hypothetical protein
MSREQTILRAVVGVAACVACSYLGAIIAGCISWAWAYESVRQRDALCTQVQYDGHSTGSCEQHEVNLEHGGNVTFSWTQEEPGEFAMLLYEADGDRTWKLEPGTTGHWGGEAKARLSPGGYSLEVYCAAGTDYYVIVFECP